MTQAQDLALSVLLSQQAKENVTVIVQAPRKLSVVKAPKEVFSTSNDSRPANMPTVSFDNRPGDYSAAEFMMRYRRAHDRNAVMIAINGFIGYDNAVAFSINEYNAKTSAQKALKPTHHKTVEAPKTKGKGFVTGIPDNNFKKISDLMGREQLAAEALSKFELQIANLTEGSTEQLTAIGMAEIERERLIAIRSDLSLLVK